MAYLGIAFILVIAYFIEWLEDLSDRKQTDKIEKTHTDMYSLIDEHYSGRENRERKAQVDAMIGALCKDNNRNYKPTKLKQVTTVEERKKRIKAELNGAANDDELVKAQLLDALDCGFEFDDETDGWYYEEHTQEEKREHLIQYFINTGASRHEAEVSADNFFKFVGGLDNGR